MSLINSQILPFHANAFRDGELVEVSQDDIAGKWAIFFFYPGDSVSYTHLTLPTI